MDPTFKREAEAIVAERTCRLRALTWEAVGQFPDEVREDMVIAGQKCSLGTFTISLYGQPELLVAVQVSTGANDKPSFAMERGLVFSPDLPVREAAEQELRDTGGGNPVPGEGSWS